MADDIFEQVREEILKEDAKYLPWVPKHLDKTWETQAGIAGAIAGVIAGASLGMHLGLAGAWGAIAGTIPCAVVGGIIGYFSGAKVGSKIQRDKSQNLWTNRSESVMVAGSDQTRQIQSADRCSFCNARKAWWWDSSRNQCIMCNNSEPK